MENKGKTWSHGTNSRLPFGVNLNLNLSNSFVARGNRNNKGNRRRLLAGKEKFFGL